MNVLMLVEVVRECFDVSRGGTWMFWC